MKLLLTCLLGSSLFLFSACKPQDQKLITKVQGEINTRQGELGHYASVGASLEKFQRELETTFPSQENAPADSLKIKANAMVNKEKSALAEYKEGLTDLTNRLAEYQAGKAKKDALELEYVVANTSLGNMKQTFAILERQDLLMRTELDQRLRKPAAR